MKHIASILLAVALLAPSTARADEADLDGALMVGVNLGQLPWGGSFKPGLTFGYHIDEHAYVGVVYQIGDSIQRDGSSFNAQGIPLDGLRSSSEDVGQRVLLHARLRPHRLSPYVSLGMVWNGEDRETTHFDDGTSVVQTRPSGVRPAIGLGYGYTFGNGLELSAEWAGWVFDRPDPEVEIRGSSMSEREQAEMVETIADNFRSHITNAYHVFMVGAGYAF